ncbi:hypothetical protein AB4308_19610, partial [Vibrio breoganii]
LFQQLADFLIIIHHENSSICWHRPNLLNLQLIHIVYRLADCLIIDMFVKLEEQTDKDHNLVTSI